MKKLLMIALLTVFIFGFLSCEDDEDKDNPQEQAESASSNTPTATQEYDPREEIIDLGIEESINNEAHT